MSNFESKSLVPELRFPEFRDAGAWEEKPLKKIFSIFQGFAFSSKDSVKDGVRWLKIADVSIQHMNHSSPSYLPTEHKNKHEKYSVKQGDYVIALTRPILRKQLKMAPVDKVFHGALLNQRVGKLVTTQNIEFIYNLLQTSKIISDIEKSISGSEPPNLSTQQIEDIKTYIPSCSKEQKKIAYCLSSIDNLITAHTQKYETLKAHKKGLLQQLFPAEDEAEPELRFPEFSNNGGWKKINFSTLFEIGGGKDHKHLPDGDIPVYGSGGYMRSVNSFLYDGESACIGRKGTINKPMFLEGKFWTVDTLFYTHSFNECSAKFIYLLFQNTNWLKLNEAGGVPSLSKVIINKVEVRVPCIDEQNEIVETIWSIDRLIYEQEQKITTLKNHKKGLMQKLFPAVNKEHNS
jgi:type I restriction enzyme S subunit